MHHLSLLLLLPIFGAILIAVIPGKSSGLIRSTAIAFSSLALIVSWSLLLSFDSSIAAIQFTESYPWNSRLGTSFTIGVDGISLPVILLATLLSWVAIIASASITQQTKGYYALMLLLESAMLGVFMAQDWTLFYLFWEFTLIPLFFLIDRWGGEKRHTASLNFVLYTMGGSVFMLLSILLLFDASPNHSFAMADIAKVGATLDPQTQVWIFLGFLIGFGVKMPIFPIHAWLPLAHVQAPSPVSILLSGILLKMGSYGIIKAAIALPGAMLVLQNFLFALAIFSILYGGILAWKQTDIKRMIAYSSVSHMGVVLVGIASLTAAGLSGAVTQMVAHGLVAGAMFLLVGLLYERTHTRELSHYGSLIKATPKFAVFMILTFVAAVGLPGTASFIAELHIIIAGFQVWGWSVIALSLGVLISAAYAIRTITHLYTGPINKDMLSVPDLKTKEVFLVGVLVITIFYIGLFPAYLLALISTSIEQVSHLFVSI